MSKNSLAYLRAHGSGISLGAAPNKNTTSGLNIRQSNLALNTIIRDQSFNSFLFGGQGLFQNPHELTPNRRNSKSILKKSYNFNIAATANGGKSDINPTSIIPEGGALSHLTNQQLQIVTDNKD